MVIQKTIRKIRSQLPIVIALLMFMPTESEAQNGRIEKLQNSHLSPLNTYNRTPVISNFAYKSKSFFDNDIAEVKEQWRSGESWYDQYRSVYRYSENRETIFVDYYLTDNMGGWNTQGLFTIELTSEGRPISYSTDYGPEIKSKITFYYSAAGILDSLIENYEEHFDYEGELYDYVSIYRVNFIHHNSDSIGLREEFTIIDDEGEDSYTTNGHLVHKQGNMEVVYQSENFTDRYVTYSTNFKEYFDHFLDPFYFKEEYNDENYGEGWIPYSRTTLSESDEKIVALTYELYDQDDTMEWYVDSKDTFQYDGDTITQVDEFGYFDGVEYHDYRTLYSYGGIVPIEEVDTDLTFTLSQNYPNPFNPSTVISYQVPFGGKVQLKVFDILGREMAILVDGTFHAGSYKVQFDASGFSNGVYIYQLQTEYFTKTKTMTLIK